MKKLMILGAGIYQVPLIKRAREMGLYTIAVSIPGNYPGFSVADKAIYENTVDAERILEIAKAEKIDGICTSGTDVAVVTIGKVCDALGLAGVSEEGARVACDKALMKRAFIEGGVRTAECRYVRINPAEGPDGPENSGGAGKAESIREVRESLRDICGEIGYPVIMKAIDSSGSRGITKVSSPEDIDRAYKAVCDVTRHNEFLVEKYLEGDEFGAQGFVQNGRLEFVLPHGDYVFKGDTGVPVGHFAPFDLPGIEGEIRSQTERAVRAMKLDNCALNIDFMLSDGEPYVLEIGARGGATCLVELTGIYFGYDYYEKIIRAALGEHVSFEPENAQRVANASHLLMSGRDGVITEIKNENPAGGSLYEVLFDYNVGDRVRKFHVGPDRIGHVIVTGRDLADAEKNLKDAMDKVKISVE